MTLATITADQLPDRLPARQPEVEIAEFTDAIVVLDLRNTMAHELLGTPAAVFDACGEGVATACLVDELVDAGIGDFDAVRELVASVLRDLADLGLLDGCDAPTPPPCIECGAGEARKQRRWWKRSRREGHA